MFTLFEQAFRADLRAFTGFLTLFIIINIICMINLIFFGKKIPKTFLPKIIMVWIVVNLVIVVLVPMSIARRYQEKLIPNNKIDESAIENRMYKKRKKMGIE